MPTKEMLCEAGSLTFLDYVHSSRLRYTIRIQPHMLGQEKMTTQGPEESTDLRIKENKLLQGLAASNYPLSHLERKFGFASNNYLPFRSS